VHRAGYNYIIIKWSFILALSKGSVNYSGFSGITIFRFLILSVRDLVIALSQLHSYDGVILVLYVREVVIKGLKPKVLIKDIIVIYVVNL